MDDTTTPSAKPEEIISPLITHEVIQEQYVPPTASFEVLHADTANRNPQNTQSPLTNLDYEKKSLDNSSND